MAPKKKGVTIPTLQSGFGVEEGAEITIVLPECGRLTLIAGGIMEVALHGSSLGLGTEEWFAMSIDSVSGTAATGFCVAGTLMGCEADRSCWRSCWYSRRWGSPFVPNGPLWRQTSCNSRYSHKVVEAFKLRRSLFVWRRSKASEKTARDREEGGGCFEWTYPASKEAGSKPWWDRSGKKKKEGSGGYRDRSNTCDFWGGRGRRRRGCGRPLGWCKPCRVAGAPQENKGEDFRREQARQKGRSRRGCEWWTATRSYQTCSGKIGPSQWDGPQTWEDNALWPDATGGYKRRWYAHFEEEEKSSAGAATSLLAQAVQASAADAQARKEKKRAKDKENPIKQLVALLKGKSKKKKNKKDGKPRKSRQRAKALTAMKPDPGDPDPDDSSSSTRETSSGDEGERSEAESDLSFEPPLRKKALRDPGSVMEMLVRHAQQQLDRGSLMDTEAEGGALTSGVKIATYFALLIRPYHQPGSPLLRELYSLAQSIDLLRAGRLPETADALASRFVAVHTALTDGGWGTASQLELHPLEPVQSASTATMLEAQKHRRLVLKSQGLGTTSWWSTSGKGKGGFPYREKGKKGDGKVKGRGKGRGSGKDAGWSGSKGESNPWRENKEEAPKK